MRFASLVLAVIVCVASPCRAERKMLRSYLAFDGGMDILTTNLDGDVVRDRFIGLTEIGVGYQLNPRMLIEVTYGWLGRHQQDPPIYALQQGEVLTEAQRAFRVTLNPLLFRLRYAHSGQRVEYAKPEISLGLGMYQVTRLLRNVPSVPPEETSQLLPVLELGTEALFVFSRNFMGHVGGRYAITSRSDIVDNTRHFDGASLVLGFRIFLPSPRDANEP